MCLLHDIGHMRTLPWPRSLLFLGWILGALPPVALTLALMPIVPAIQEWDVVPFAHPLARAQWWMVGAGFVVFTLAAITLWQRPGRRWKVTPIILALVGIGLHTAVATMFSAEAMFNEPFTVRREAVDVAAVSSDTTVYLWVNVNGSVAGYPLDLVAHHHKIKDTVGGTDVLITYCTMCHTGRVFSPIVNGASEQFRLVGANHFNAMFEDVRTKSWWYQATGECVAGPLKGAVLADIPFVQGTAAEMRALWSPHHVSLFRADAATGDAYAWADGYARKAGDTSRTLSRRSLVIGVRVGSAVRAYPVRRLIDAPDSVIRDVIDGTTIVMRRPHTMTETIVVRRDSLTSATVIPSVVDYWHAWEHFYPTTTVWEGTRP